MGLINQAPTQYDQAIHKTNQIHTNKSNQYNVNKVGLINQTLQKEIGKFVAINNQKVYNYYLNNNLRHTAGLAYLAHPVSQVYFLRR